jgi:hypothetical protein
VSASCSPWRARENTSEAASRRKCYRGGRKEERSVRRKHVARAPVIVKGGCLARPARGHDNPGGDRSTGYASCSCPRSVLRSGQRMRDTEHTPCQCRMRHSRCGEGGRLRPGGAAERRAAPGAATGRVRRSRPVGPSGGFEGWPGQNGARGSLRLPRIRTGGVSRSRPRRASGRACDRASCDRTRGSAPPRSCSPAWPGGREGRSVSRPPPSAPTPPDRRSR